MIIGGRDVFQNDGLPPPKTSERKFDLHMRSVIFF
jgi:hypothetical protein